MRRLPLLLFAACGGGTYNQGRDPTGDSGDTASGDDTGPTGDDTDTGPVDTDTGPTWAGTCGNWMDPVDLAGWTRTYTVDYNGSASTQTHSGVGEVAAAGTYDYTMMGDGADRWDGTVSTLCVTEGLELKRGRYEVVTGGSSIGTYVVEYDPPIRTMADEGVAGDVGSWSYTTTVHIKTVDEKGVESDMLTAEASGTFVELGDAPVSVGSETLTGLKLAHTYDMSSEGLWGFGAFDVTGYVEQVYVPGVGLATEELTQTDNSNGSTVAIDRALTGYTGLAAIQ